MDYRLLIKGGTVVDGAGAPAYAADVRIADGRIAEVGPELQSGRGERVVDATGCYVTPGFIEMHNHWDGGVWWTPNMDPLPGYGATTSINGNCGFSLAPAPRGEAEKQNVIDIFNFFEDIPEEPMRKLVPWDWQSWSEYKASMVRNVSLPLNYAAFCGHIALRLCVIGQDCWQRAATGPEIDRMCAMLEDALAAGAMGLSSNFLDYDKYDRPLPSQQADDAELAALLAVIARYPRATFQVIVDHFMRKTGNNVVERLASLSAQAGVRMQWIGMPIIEYQADQLPRAQVLHQQFKDQGLEIYSSFLVISFTSVINFSRTLVFAQNGNPVWQELTDLSTWAEKAAWLADPEWRARARQSWDSQFDHSYLHDPSALTLRDSETGFGPTGITLADYMRENGFGHASDALAEWVLNNGQESVLLKKSWALDEIEMRPEKKIWDVPDGTARTYRYTRDPAPMRLTLVNGIPTFDKAEFAGRYPGEFIGPEAARAQDGLSHRLPASHLETA